MTVATNARGVLAETDDLRLLQLNNPIWIGYPQAQAVRAELDALLVHPKVHRMPNLAVIGETNNGKTTILNEFVAENTPVIDPNDDKTVLPVIMVETPAAPDESRIYQSLLERLHCGGSPREHVDAKLRRLTLILDRLETRMIILDEFSNMLASTPRNRERVINTLKYLGNELRIPIVVAGVPRTLMALTSDPQMANRFRPAFLPRWSDALAYARLLVSFEGSLLLRKKCDFTNKPFVTEMLNQTEGLIGETSELLRRLADRAIRTGEETINLDSLRPEVLKDVYWVKPGLRQKYAAVKTR